MSCNNGYPLALAPNTDQQPQIHSNERTCGNLRPGFWATNKFALGPGGATIQQPCYLHLYAPPAATDSGYGLLTCRSDIQKTMSHIIASLQAARLGAERKGTQSHPAVITHAMD